MFDSVVTNALFIGRVEKGAETSVYILEFAVIRSLDCDPLKLSGIGTVTTLLLHSMAHMVR